MTSASSPAVNVPHTPGHSLSDGGRFAAPPRTAASVARGLVQAVWAADRPLAVTGLVMLPVLTVSVIGLWLDPRLVTGAPAWLKPAKFAISITIYAYTLAWIFTYLPAWTRTRRLVGRLTAAVLVGEMAIVVVQAARGVASHFNVGTTLDALLFSTMGVAIVGQTVASIAIAVALWRQHFEDRALGWALRLAMTLTIVGAFIGGAMTRPTVGQLEAARVARPAVVGAHTVGADDGGPGLPGTGWSTTAGDLRVAHFAGLHALQILPLVAIGLGRRRISSQTRTRLTLVAAASYASLIGLLFWQALRGEPVAAPGAGSLAMFAAWAGMTALAAATAAATSRRRHPASPIARGSDR